MLSLFTEFRTEFESTWAITVYLNNYLLKGREDQYILFDRQDARIWPYNFSKNSYTLLLLNPIFVQMKVYFELIDISEYKCKVHIYS